MIARDHAPTPRAMRLPIRPWHPCRGWPDVSSGRKEGREMHGGLLWAAFEEWAAHHHSARRSIGLHRHAASEPHRLLLGPVPAAGRPARQRAWPTWPRLKHPEKSRTTTLNEMEIGTLTESRHQQSNVSRKASLLSSYAFKLSRASVSSVSTFVTAQLDPQICGNL